MNVVRTFLSFRRSCSEDPKMSGSFAYFCLSKSVKQMRKHTVSIFSIAWSASDFNSCIIFKLLIHMLVLSLSVCGQCALSVTEFSCCVSISSVPLQVSVAFEYWMS